MKNILKKLVASMFVVAYASSLSAPVSAQEGKADSYEGHVPANTTFAFVDSRYYDGSNYVKVFNVGLYMSTPGQYYANGDWADLTRVYHREDYYKNAAFKAFTDSAATGAQKPAGYPTNDVGGEADGILPSYNAGIYTTLSWHNFKMFGRNGYNNYGIDSVINVPAAPTYVEIWKVAPDLTLHLNLNGNVLHHSDTFTLVLGINNHFNNMKGLPTNNEVAFEVNGATPISPVTKTNNVYTQQFRVSANSKQPTILIKAGVLNTAKNYKGAYKAVELPLES